MASPYAILDASVTPLYQSMYQLDISSLLGTEYRPLIDDIVRMVCIQVTIQLMMFLSGGGSPFFTAEFALLVVYVVLGVMLYWLVIRKIIAIV